MSKQQVALALLSLHGFRQLPDHIKQEVKLFQTLPSIQAITWTVHPRRANKVARIKQVLLNFTDEAPEGRAFYQLTGHKGMHEVTAGQMRSMDTYPVWLYPC